MNILTNYDFNQNQIMNASMHKLAIAPANPVQGQSYYNTTSKRAFYWNGTEWTGMDAIGATMTGSDIVAAINNSPSIIDLDNLHSSVAAVINDSHDEAHTIDSHSNVTITDNSSGEILKWDGVAWINNTLSEAGIAAANHAHQNLTAGDGITGSDYTGGAAQTWSIVSAPGTVGSIGTLTILEDTIGVSLGTTGTTACAGNDTRLSNARTPLSHKHGNISNDGKIGTASGLVVVTTAEGTLSTLDSGSSGQFLQYDGTWATPNNSDTITKVKGTDGTAVSGEVLIQGSAPIATSQSGQNITIAHSVTDGNKHIPANGTTNSGKVLTAGATAGIYTWETPAVTWGNVSGAPTNIHNQNTDTGTSSATFQLNNAANGVKIKNSSGMLEVRNSEDTDYADIKIKNLTVNGTTTIINSNEVNIGDNIILLNSDVATNYENSDGGIAVKRLMTDNSTRKDAELIYDASNNRWKTTFGAVANPLRTAQIANKITAAIGNGSSTSYTVTHNFGSRDCAVGIRETNSPYAGVICDWEFTSEDAITFKFAVPPTNNQYTVTIVG